MYRMFIEETASVHRRHSKCYVEGIKIVYRKHSNCSLMAWQMFIEGKIDVYWRHD